MKKVSEQERRLAGFCIPYPFLLDTLMKEGTHLNRLKVTKGIPADAVYVTAYREDASMQIVFVFEHPSFSLVAVGGTIPLSVIEYDIEYADPAG